MLPVFFPPEEQALTLLAFLNSLCFDYFARQKMSRQGLDLYKIKQIPVPLPGRNLSSEVQHEIETRVARLIGWQSFAATIISGKLASDTEIPILEEASRSIVRAEIDALCAHAYGLGRKDLCFILDPSPVFTDYPSETFKLLKEGEINEHGEYRTQRLVLEAWDRLFGS